MKPLFGVLVLIFICFFIEIEAADNLRKIATKYTTIAAEPDDEARKEDHRKTLVLGTPARPKKPRAPLYSDFLAKPDLPDKTGEKAFKLFLDHYRERNLPNTLKESLDLYNERHAGGSYHLPEEQRGSLNQRFDEARRRAKEPLVKEHHQQMYKQYQDCQDHSTDSGLSLRDADHRYQNQYNVRDQSGGSGLGSGNNHPTTLVIDTHARPKKPRGPRQKSRAAHGPCYLDFLVKPDLPDKTGKNAHALFLNHYREKGLPNTPKESLDLYNERHAGGSYHLPKEQGGSLNQRFGEARRRAKEPLVKEHHQQMYKQYQDFQDHSTDSGLSLRDDDHRYQNQYNVRDQSGGSGLGFGNNNNPYTAPPRTPSPSYSID